MFAKISIYSLKMGGWNEFKTIKIKNNHGTKLIEALPNHQQILFQIGNLEGDI
jgi:hypothetical protein